MNLTPIDLSLTEFTEAVTQRIRDVISQQTTSLSLLEALDYVTQPGGKLIRPRLMYEFMAVGGGLVNNRALIDCAVALELIHIYSLIHDDLPSMDHALLRRGRPTCWSAYNEATAILVGDSLIPLAFELLSNLSLPSQAKNLALISLVAKAIGPRGLVAGQMMDLFPDFHKSETQEQQIETMQILKTGALFGAACGGGMILSGQHLEREAFEFGEQFGILYQLTDDLLDRVGTEGTTGKTLNHDQHKRTYLSLFGIEKTREKIHQISSDLINRIAMIFDDSLSLQHLVQEILYQIE